MDYLRFHYLVLEKFVGKEEHQVVEGNDFQMRWVLNLVLKGQNFGWQREGDSCLTDTRSLREFSKDCVWNIMNELIRLQKSFWLSGRLAKKIVLYDSTLTFSRSVRIL